MMIIKLSGSWKQNKTKKSFWKVLNEEWVSPSLRSYIAHTSEARLMNMKNENEVYRAWTGR